MESFCPSNLLLGDPRLFLAVPFVIIQTAAVTVKYIKIMDRHLKDTEKRFCHHFTDRTLTLTFTISENELSFKSR